MSTRHSVSVAPAIVLGLVSWVATVGIDALAAPLAPRSAWTSQQITRAQRTMVGAANAKPSTKMSRELAELSAAYEAHVQTRSRTAFTSRDPLVRVVEDRVIVDAVAAGETGRLQSDLQALGARNVAAFGAVVSAEVPLSRLGDLAQLASLHWARPAVMMTSVGATTSQGDAAMRADVARMRIGIDGTGVTVGTLSDSFDCQHGAARDIANGDLPRDIVVLKEDPGCMSGTDEGRAMMQLIHDVAPGAKQLFRTAGGGEADFAVGIGELVAAGADIIVDDVRYFTEPFFQDGIIAQAAQSAADMGIPYFSSAGNYGADSYESPFRNSGETGPGGGILHDFNPGAGVDTLQHIVVPPFGKVTLILQWDQPHRSVSGPPGATSDVDVYIYECFLFCSIVAKAVEDNLATGDPIELVSFGGFTDHWIAIELFSGPTPRLLKYIVVGDADILEYDTQSSTLVGHANAAGSEAVAAAFYGDTPTFGITPPVVEPFSSRGGTPILFSTAGIPVNERRVKPEITAPDGTNTTFFGGDDIEMDGFPNFSGTSAAAPHAAAVAALLLEATPSLSPAQVYATLEGSAIDMGSPGFDVDSGFGLIQADVALPRCVTGSCDDGNPCTNDVCDPATGCHYAPNTSPCSDGTECTLADRCNGGQCQAGTKLTAGGLSTLVTAGVNASLTNCRSDKPKQVKKVVNRLKKAAKAFSRAEVAGVGTKKWAKRVAKGEKTIRTAQSKLARVQAKLSSACVSQLGEAISTGALGDACLP
jgi:subtilisin family serine protease